MTFALVDGRVISEPNIRCMSCLNGFMVRQFTADPYGFAWFRCNGCGHEETRTI